MPGVGRRGPGKLTLPAKKLFEIVRVLPETDVRIEQDKSGVKVAADRFDSRMQTMPPDDFPTLPRATGDASLSLPAGLLCADDRAHAVRDHER